ncbi:unnamed protein product [Bursaphelenchus xylophilus]|uniref:(pine wood nematode) hypothetical protein n=1 Tax=Bursaphelenchus xylophilus TaxID=6326 RepID=A0A1I7RM56_BURXY|nr:unnamed protein product [Bursaphelenchus xylophilus]CAG9118219.1 unnamed protein product [Bursaphelenchus xylophilus]
MMPPKNVMLILLASLLLFITIQRLRSYENFTLLRNCTAEEIKEEVTTAQSENKTIEVLIKPVVGINGLAALPPFKDSVTHMIFADRYKLGACLLPKVMSTVMTAVLCYLNDDKAFLNASRDIATERFGIRFCEEKIERYSMSKFEDEFNKDHNYTMFTVVREPIDRFLAAFVDKCYYEPRRSTNHYDCYGCGESIKCFINRMHTRFWYYLGGRHTLDVLDHHVMPQTWHCDMQHYLQKYKILRYVSHTSESYNSFLNELNSTLTETNVPQAQRQHVLKALSTSSSYHTTTGKSQRQLYEDRVRGNPHLMEKLINIYYYDYVTFGFKIPEINV